MRILFPIHGYPPYQMGGVEVYTSGLCEALSNTDEVAVVYPVLDSSLPKITLRKYTDASDTLRYEIIGNFSNLRRIFYDIKQQEREGYLDAFDHVLSDFSPDVVHFQHLLSYPALDALKKVASRSIPVAYTVHDHWLICPSIHYLRSDDRPCTGPRYGLWTCAACLRNMPLTLANRTIGLFHNSGMLSLVEKTLPSTVGFKLFLQRNQIMKQVISQIDVLISPSRSLIEQMAFDEMTQEKVRYIPNGHKPLPPCPDPTSRTRAHPPTVGFLGTITRGKGVHLLLKAAEILHAEIPELNIRIYGIFLAPPFEDYVTQSVQQLPNVRLMGPYHRDNLACILAQLDCVIVPSIWYENSPLVISEAFLAGKPVITANQGGMAEMVDNGQRGGMMFEAGKAESLAEVVVRFFRDDELREKVCETIPPVVTFDQHIRELKKLYVELANTFE